MSLISKPVTKIILSIIFAAHLFMLVLVLAALAHEAHGTGMAYDPECCSGYDCAPATAVVLNPDGSRTITNGNGHTATFGATFKHRQSTDGRLHACIGPLSGRAICLYASEGM